MGMRVWISMGLTFAALASCSSLSDDACKAGDWESIGFRDGAAGRSPDYVLNHAKACNDIGVAPNRTNWLRGYEEGLTRYCIPEVAFEEGRDGNRLSNVCPVEMSGELRAANDQGLRWYRLERDISDNEARIRSINAALADLADGDPARTQLVGERSILRLENLRLRSRQAAIRF